jgi:hypothetical protein
LRYSRGRRRREITLGSYPELTLSEARKKTRFYRARIDAGEGCGAKSAINESVRVSI